MCSLVLALQNQTISMSLLVFVCFGCLLVCTERKLKKHAGLVTLIASGGREVNIKEGQILTCSSCAFNYYTKKRYNMFIIKND